MNLIETAETVFRTIHRVDDEAELRELHEPWYEGISERSNVFPVIDWHSTDQGYYKLPDHISGAYSFDRDTSTMIYRLKEVQVDAAGGFIVPLNDIAKTQIIKRHQRFDSLERSDVLGAFLKRKILDEIDSALLGFCKTTRNVLDLNEGEFWLLLFTECKDQEVPVRSIMLSAEDYDFVTQKDVDFDGIDVRRSDWLHKGTALILRDLPENIGLFVNIHPPTIGVGVHNIDHVSCVTRGYYGAVIWKGAQVSALRCTTDGIIRQ